MKISRRKFIGISGGIIAAGIAGRFILKKKNSENIIQGSIVGADSSRGHLLRNKNFPAPFKFEERDVVIVGGGVSALSAARCLNKNNFKNFVMLELADNVGGNAVSGINSVSEYPWGAHYIPVPNNNQTELLSFLHENGVITSFDERGIPSFNEFYLCSDPQERLFINGFWQEGLIPEFGVPESDRKQILDFLKMMNEFRFAKGSDGKDAFCIPVCESSRDEEFTSFDKVSMKEFLANNKFHSSYLHWYINYCCKDDFGTTYDQTSAWAGIHYFAGRKGKGTNAEFHDVLTWPEGNAWLVRKLSKDINIENRRTGCVAYNVTAKEDFAYVDYFDTRENCSVRIRAGQVILATPQFVNDRILNFPERKKITSGFSYSPWMVANLTVKKIPEKKGASLSWDNVIYGSDSLGYVNACNQHISQQENKKVLTYYFPLCNNNPKDERTAAYSKSHSDWVEIIVNDLKRTQPDIRDYIEEANVWLWGHAMIQPLTGFLFGGSREEAGKSIDDIIYFAHSDISGMSIFEEAFYRGNIAAEAVLKRGNKA